MREKTLNAKNEKTVYGNRVIYNILQKKIMHYSFDEEPFNQRLIIM